MPIDATTCCQHMRIDQNIQELGASLPILLVLVLVISLVASARVLARQVGFVVPFGFIGAYLLGVGALTLINVRALEWRIQSSIGSTFG